MPVTSDRFGVHGFAFPGSGNFEVHGFAFPVVEVIAPCRIYRVAGAERATHAVTGAECTTDAVAGAERNRHAVSAACDCEET